MRSVRHLSGNNDVYVCICRGCNSQLHILRTMQCKMAYSHYLWHSLMLMHASAVGMIRYQRVAALPGTL